MLNPYTREMQKVRNPWQEATARLLKQATYDDVLAASIAWHLTRIARSTENRWEYEVHRPKGWTFGAFRIMSQLYIIGPQEPSQLAEALQLSRPTITLGVDRLVKDRYVTREAQESNRRRQLVRLTDSGRDACESVVESHHMIEMDIVSGLTRKERVQLAALLEKMYRTLQN